MEATYLVLLPFLIATLCNRLVEIQRRTFLHRETNAWDRNECSMQHSTTAAATATATLIRSRPSRFTVAQTNDDNLSGPKQESGNKLAGSRGTELWFQLGCAGANVVFGRMQPTAAGLSLGVKTKDWRQIVGPPLLELLGADSN